MPVETNTHLKNTPENPTIESLRLPQDVVSYDLPEAARRLVDDLDLPRGYALMGGAARAIAAEVLNMQPLPVRDIDIVAVSDLNPDLDYVPELNDQLMADDAQFGHGVKLESLEHYFASRDFTINELLVVDDKLLISKRGESDTLDDIIRPSLAEHDPSDPDSKLGPKLVIKAIVLQSVWESHGFEPEIQGIDLHKYRCVSDYYNQSLDIGQEPMRHWWVAIGYQKALDYGTDVSYRFIDHLLEYGIIEPNQLGHDDTVSANLGGLANLLRRETNFEFRGAAKERLDALTDENISLGDMLFAIGQGSYQKYEQYHKMAQDYGGLGREYTDESKY